MKRMGKLIKQIRLRPWWGMLLAFVAVMIFAELLDHVWLQTNAHLGANMLLHVLLFGMLTPALIALIVIWTESGDRKREAAFLILERRREFSKQLSLTTDWDALTRLIVQFPVQIVPTIGASLLIYRAGVGQLELAAEWRLDGKLPLNSLTTQPGEDCLHCTLTSLSHVGKYTPCDYVVNGEVQTVCYRYCLPLMVGQCRIALLHVDFLPGVELNHWQFDTLNAVAQEMALALDRAAVHRVAAQQVQLTDLERQRIAQELHDMLGQNIAYLRLKIEQLSSGDLLTEIEHVQRELEHMRVVANEAYQQVRGVLDDLRISPTAELMSLLREQVTLFEQRTRIVVTVTSSGQPRSLSPRVLRQILFILKEALSNISKHANTHSASVSVQWTDEALILEVRDAGKGFDLVQLSSDGHYGLAIMHERSQSIGAELQIQSVPGLGTRLTLTIPGENQAEPANPCLPVGAFGSSLVLTD